MDIELLKTFLEVHRTRHFGRAAENLYLTQSAVSARIRQLEQVLGTDLFVRTRNNIHLTPAGERLAPHAESVLTVWERARQDVALSQGLLTRLAIAAPPSIWDSWLQMALQRLMRDLPDIALRADVYSDDSLGRRLIEDALDLAVCFDPPKSYDLVVKEVDSLSLIMVSSRSGQAATAAVSDRYIQVDWGTTFKVEHARAFVGMPPSVLHTSSGRIALDFLLANGGAVYLPEPVARPYLDESVLFLVEDAPVFNRAVHVVHKSAHERPALIERIVGLLTLCSSYSPQSLQPGRLGANQAT
ncbi:LysR family transcriptional regulator [Mangrovitalea sediminis]|uniref:LysR family transcriptional regulator n=1 Tax=Mangrovitalea sediminis TaxID=1982043 RepID=UPI000BE6257B|nr:LysR family transcriptional regulator [Mangrovitalea sediminis]